MFIRLDLVLLPQKMIWVIFNQIKFTALDQSSVRGTEEELEQLLFKWSFRTIFESFSQRFICWKLLLFGIRQLVPRGFEISPNLILGVHPCPPPSTCNQGSFDSYRGSGIKLLRRMWICVSSKLKSYLTFIFWGSNLATSSTSQVINLVIRLRLKQMILYCGFSSRFVPLPLSILIILRSCLSKSEFYF